MQTPLVSVYLPTRNRSVLLERAVRSVLAQSHQHIELIVVDDFSTDETEDLMERYTRIDSRIVYIRNTSTLGAPTSRNKAISAATGEFVTGLDDDDSFESNRISSFLHHLSTHKNCFENSSCLYSNAKLIRNSAQVATTSRPPLVAHHDLFSANFVGNQIFAPKAHFVEAGLFTPELSAWQDLDLLLRITKRFGPAILVENSSYIVDCSDRFDRISLAATSRLKQAMNFVRSKHSRNSLEHQLLYVQLHWNYSIPVSVRDIVEFFSLGLHPAIAAKFLLCTPKAMLHKIRRGLRL